MENYGKIFIRNYLDLIKVFTLHSNTYIAANFEEEKIQLSYMNAIWSSKRVLFIELEEFLIDHFHIPGTLQNTQKSI